MIMGDLAGISNVVYAAAAFLASVGTLVTSWSARKAARKTEAKVDVVHKLVNGKADQTDQRLDSLEAKVDEA